jgi:hypothetical protein
MSAVRGILLAALLALRTSFAADISPLAGTQPLTIEGDLSAQMVAGIGRYLDRETTMASAARLEKWKTHDPKDAEAKRKLLRERLGMSDEPMSGGLEIVQPVGAQPVESRAAGYRLLHVRWPVFADVWGEGLLLQPLAESRATIVAIPDADQTPEQIAGTAPGVAAESQFARRLAEQGCTVLVPVLVDRRTTWSGTDLFNRWTNLPHREFVYRQAFEVGRTLVGYEVQKVLCGLDALGCTEATKCGVAWLRRRRTHRAARRGARSAH